jgi:hypothetical protein
LVAGGCVVVVVILIVPVAGMEVLNHPVAANTADTPASARSTTMSDMITIFFILFSTCPLFLPRPKAIKDHFFVYSTR